MKIPPGWHITKLDNQHVQLTCDNNHVFDMPVAQSISRCPTCSVTGFYKILIDMLKSITGESWLIARKNRRVQYAYNGSGCRIGAHYPRTPRIHVDIVVDNKYPKFPDFMAYLEHELLIKLSMYDFEDVTKNNIASYQRIYHINEPEFKHVEVKVLRDAWLEDCFLHM